MTNRREVDLDLIADYIGGALEGTPQAAAVERLIADDPAWSRAYAQTSAAMEAVRADLGALGAERDQMPAEVLGRLEAALAPVLPEKAGTVVRLADRRRWMRRLVPVAVAAAVLGCVGLGATVLLPDSGDREASNSAGSGQGDRGPAPAAAGPEVPSTFSVGGSAEKRAVDDARVGVGRSAPRTVATGTDYTRDTVARFTDTQSTIAKAAPSGVPAAAGGAVPEELRRLTAPDALSACLAVVATADGQPATAVRLVDFARFEGSPAVVVLLPDAVWVSGPECGRAGPDTRYSTRTQGR